MKLRVAIVGSGGRLGAALAREGARLGNEIIGSGMLTSISPDTPADARGSAALSSMCW
jgi:hypothetical protein